jgi:hypothetical protein
MIGDLERSTMPSSVEREELRMSTGADGARLTIQLREPLPIGREVVAARVIQRAHAAGMWSATFRRGAPARSAVAETAPAVDIKLPEIPSPRSVSLADEEGVTIVISGPEESFAGFARDVRDVIGDTAIVRIEDGDRMRELSTHQGPALRH